jgi:hypothetical protein
VAKYRIPNVRKFGALNDRPNNHKPCVGRYKAETIKVIAALFILKPSNCRQIYSR